MEIYPGGEKMNLVWFILGFLFGVLASFTVVYIILKRTARWIKKNGLTEPSKERREEIWDNISRM
ncbi:MAG: hypothetical protein K6G19_02990 [Lachnospiraceae bacterium]|nr:hypothetical protein [Lachnospiraceae bacterium]